MRRNKTGSESDEGQGVIVKVRRTKKKIHKRHKTQRESSGESEKRAYKQGEGDKGSQGVRLGAREQSDIFT